MQRGHARAPRSREGPLLRAPRSALGGQRPVSPPPALHLPVRLQHNMPSRRVRAVRARCPSCSMKAFIALPQDDLGLARAIVKLYGMECSMAACLHGMGMARTCDPSRLERQSQSQRLGTDGIGLLRCRLSRPSTIRPQVSGLWSCSQKAVQVGAGPMPRRHAAMLQPQASQVPAQKHNKDQLVTLAQHDEIYQQLRYVEHCCRAGCNVLMKPAHAQRETWHYSLNPESSLSCSASCKQI